MLFAVVRIVSAPRMLHRLSLYLPRREKKDKERRREVAILGVLSIQYTEGYNDFDFFEKINSPGPLMDAKSNSKTNV